MFRTFSSVKKKKFTLGKVLLFLMAVDILVIVGLLVLSFFPQFYRRKDFFLETTFTLNMILAALFLIAALNYVIFKDKNNSKVTGNIDLQEDEVIFDDQRVPLGEIEKIRFIGNDVKGDFRGFLSKGIRNQIIVVLKNGGELKAFFEQTTENNLIKRKNILEIYHRHGKMSDSNFQNILRNTNYY